MVCRSQYHSIQIQWANTFSKYKHRERGDSIRLYLFGVVKTLEIVFTEKRAVFGFSATRHTLTEIHPEIITPPFVPSYPPSRRHWFWFWPHDILPSVIYYNPEFRWMVANAIDHWILLMGLSLYLGLRPYLGQVVIITLTYFISIINLIIYYFFVKCIL